MAAVRRYLSLLSLPKGAARRCAINLFKAISRTWVFSLAGPVGHHSEGNS
jgi:hypothetical protein